MMLFKKKTILDEELDWICLTLADCSVWDWLLSGSR